MAKKQISGIGRINIGEKKMGITIIIIVCLIYFYIKKTNENSIKSGVINNVWKRLEAYELFKQYMDSTDNQFYHLTYELSGMREKELTPKLKERLKTILGNIRETIEKFNTQQIEARKHDAYKGALSPLSPEEEPYLTKLERFFVSRYIQQVKNKAYAYGIWSNDLIKTFNKTMEHFGISEKDLE